MARERQKMNEAVRVIRWRMSNERLRFRDEMKIIPCGVWYACVTLVLIGQVVANLLYHLIPPERRAPDMPYVAYVGAALGMSVFISLVLLMFGYINRDAKRRKMSPAFWTFVIIVLMPLYLIGFVIYFLVREPLPYACPQCGDEVSVRFNYCPKCKYDLRPVCPQCRKEIRPGDRFCAFCAFDLSGSKVVNGEPGAAITES